MGAFVNPLMSLFIVEGLRAPPMYLGVYVVAVTIMGLVISQWLGSMADKGTSARKLFMVAVSGMVCALVAFLRMLLHFGKSCSQACCFLQWVMRQFRK